jgi:glutathione peroxidase-family protein
MSRPYDLTMRSITGDDVSFDAYRDRVLLIVNVASH